MKLFVVMIMLTASTLVIGCATRAKGPLDLPSGASAAAVKANTMGIEHYKLGDDEYGHWYTAKDYFEDAIKAEPQRAEPHFNLALTLDKLGEHAEATAEFKKAAALAPENVAITQSEAYRKHVAPSPVSGKDSGYGGGY
jgi:Tfp pilus assembly protein PilF